MSAKGIASLPEAVIDILRLGLHQLAFLERIPAHAVVDESVRLCEAVSMTPIKGLVNAILRRFPDRRGQLDSLIREDPRRLAIESSHPDWLVKWAVDSFGDKKATEWLHSNNRTPSIFLSPLVHRSPGSPSVPYAQAHKEAVQEWIQQLNTARPTPDGESIEWLGGHTLSSLSAIREGHLFVQDLGAREAVRLLNPQRGETVFDLCSAPGGKTLQIADILNREGRLVSVDSNPRRIEILQENLIRCGMDWVEVVRRDLTQSWEEAEGKADAVLVDVPCSGLGTLRRKVDLRYRLRPEDIPDLAKKSGQILQVASSLVRHGGRLVYSTCTLTHEENRGTIDRFLRSNPGGWRLDLEKNSPAWLYDPERAENASDSDGSYCALLSHH